MMRKCIIILILITSCLYGSEPAGFTTRIIYYIHGDGSYLFHNNKGQSASADERILNQALYVARTGKNSEVFILHHRPAEKFLLFFPLKNLDFYYFKSGKLINKSSFSINTQAIQLEFDLIKKYSSVQDDNIRNYFLFYGHRIPEDEGHGYNLSQPDLPFNINILQQAISSYASKPFELIVLSTCKNGTHNSINKFAGLSKYIIASPEDLPLFHISSVPFKIFAKHADINTSKFVHILAKRAFNKLIEQTFTMVTLSVYNTQELNESSDEGVTVFYKPPLFGKLKNIKQHSGWGEAPNKSKEYNETAKSKL